MDSRCDRVRQFQFRRKLAVCGSRPPRYNSIQEERRTQGPTIAGRFMDGLSVFTMMMETAGRYCISSVEIQYGFHVSKLSSRHTNAPVHKFPARDRAAVCSAQVVLSRFVQGIVTACCTPTSVTARYDKSLLS